jgi:hypothetical protein
MNSIFRIVQPIEHPECPFSIWSWTSVTMLLSPALNIKPWLSGGLYSERYFQTFISRVLIMGKALARITARRPSLRLSVAHESFI